MPRAMQVNFLDFLNILDDFVVLQVAAVVVNILARVVLPYFLVALVQSGCWK